MFKYLVLRLMFGVNCNLIYDFMKVVSSDVSYLIWGKKCKKVRIQILFSVNCVTSAILAYVIVKCVFWMNTSVLSSDMFQEENVYSTRSKFSHSLS